MPTRLTVVRADERVAVRDDLDENILAFTHLLAAERKAAKTIKLYRTAAEDLARFLRDHGRNTAVADITRDDMEAFLIDLQHRTTRYGTPTAPATLNQTFRSLQAFFLYLVKDEEVTDTPLKNIERPTIPDVPPAFPTADEMTTLLRVCDGKDFAGRRDKAILTLFYDSGVRLAEMTGIKIADLDRDLLTVYVTGKFERPRTVPFSVDTVRVIDRYLKVRKDHPWAKSPALWIGERGALTHAGITLMVRRRARQAGVDGIHPHSFRHAYADAYLSAGGEEGDLMRNAGWKSRSMVDRYGRGAAAERARRNYHNFSPMARLRGAT
ncbi:MAG: tyrosine-type recombinase/integrase [Chloroflexi bacterium]|nr:tyrosine-type recombinase/integrase [Chloroflexota bacterium]